MKFFKQHPVIPTNGRMCKQVQAWGFSNLYTNGTQDRRDRDNAGWKKGKGDTSTYTPFTLFGMYMLGGLSDQLQMPCGFQMSQE